MVTVHMIRIFLLLLLFGIAVDAGSAYALVGKKSTKPVIEDRFVPHRAIYSIKLAGRRDGVSVAGISGRMVFEVTGSSCVGYTQNMRMVTEITDEQGKKNLSDIRSSTWEQGRGHRFRFSSSQYFDRSLMEMVSGTAFRRSKGRGVRVRLDKPSSSVLDLPADVMFPTQHSLAILSNAEAGRKRLEARVYDGSEQGQKFYDTYTFIGNQVMPPRGDGKAGPDDFRKMADFGLEKLPSWPVAISYFESGETQDKTPSYELSFRLYPNGVSRKLLINYGEFSVLGTLDKITYLRKRRCK